MTQAMTHQKPSFLSAFLEFAVTLLAVVLSAFVVGYAVGSLGGPRGFTGAAGAGAVIAALWFQKRRQARKAHALAGRCVITR